MYKGATNSHKTPGRASTMAANVINRHGTGWKSYSRTNPEQFVFLPVGEYSNGGLTLLGFIQIQAVFI